MTIDCIDQIHGAMELALWFGAFPSFHDANVEELELRADANGAIGRMKITAFRMTDRVDEKGYFVQEKHCAVTMNFRDITAVDLRDFMQGAIIFDLEIKKLADEFEMTVSSSYGFGGSLRARQISIQFEPRHAS